MLKILIIKLYYLLIDNYNFSYKITKYILKQFTAK